MTLIFSHFFTEECKCSEIIWKNKIGNVRKKRTFGKLEIRGNFLNIINSMCTKRNPTINIMPNGKNFEYFSLRPGMSKECLTSSVLVSIARGGKPKRQSHENLNSYSELEKEIKLPYS